MLVSIITPWDFLAIKCLAPSKMTFHGKSDRSMIDLSESKTAHKSRVFPTVVTGMALAIVRFLGERKQARSGSQSSMFIWRPDISLVIGRLDFGFFFFFFFPPTGSVVGLDTSTRKIENRDDC